MIVNRIDELIGNTPILRIKENENDADIYIKLEYFNPGGSIKDRIALKMIESAEVNGTIKKGDTIIEPTSGNTGIGVAMVGRARGYKVIIIMPETMSLERQKIIKAFGAKLILTEGSAGMKGAIAKAENLVKEYGYFMLRQFENDNNVVAHEETTAREILTDFPKGFDCFVAGVGTGGTITGVGNIIKNKFPKTLFVAAEPVESAVLSGKSPGAHKIQGLGAGFIPKILNIKIYDEVMTVSLNEAYDTSRLMAQKYGLLIGISSGASIFSALQIAKRLGKGKKVVVIAPDNGERYLSTPLYEVID